MKAMITRSRAKAEIESSPKPTNQSRTVRKRKVGTRAHIHYQRADMGRRGGNSGRGASNRRKPVLSSEVAPTRLFSTTEEENREDEPLSRVSLGFLQSTESSRLVFSDVILEVVNREAL